MLGEVVSAASATTDHVLSTTELTYGRGAHFSMSNGGKVLRSGSQNFEVFTGHYVHGQVFDAADISLAAALRASAAFPGIPPRRIKTGPYGSAKWSSNSWSEWRSERTTYLSDGGVSNNLGTDALMRDGFLHGDHLSSFPDVVLCVDASAMLKQAREFQFQIPGWAEIATLLRQADISTVNTVQPRIDAFRANFSQRFRVGVLWQSKEVTQSQSNKTKMLPSSPAVFHVPLASAPGQTAHRVMQELIDTSLYENQESDRMKALGIALVERFVEYDSLIKGDKQLHLSDAVAALEGVGGARFTWERGLFLLRSQSYEKICDELGLYKPVIDDTSDAISNYINASARDYPEGVTPSGAVLELTKFIDFFFELQRPHWSHRWWNLIDVRTTLGRIKPTTAKDLVLMGYANTAISAYLLGLTEDVPDPTFHAWLKH